MKRILLTILILFSGNHFLNAQFTVASTTPIKNALNVNTSADITITFSDNVDPTTITATTVSISGSQGTPISFSTPTISGTNAVFNPSRDFFAGEVITITLAPGVLSTTGTGLTPFTTQFTTAVNPLSSGEFNFGQNTITTLLNGPKSVITADLDGDGDLDVLSASQNDDRIAWYENNGTGAFGVRQNITTEADGAVSVTTADLDGDGDLDVLSGSIIDNRVAWYENDGTGVFGAQQTITIQVLGAHSVTTADLDGDGDLDVLSASLADNRIAWYENDGLGTFGAQQTITTEAEFARSVATADLDGDGDMDVLSASESDDRIAWYENDGTGVFGAQQTITTEADGAFSVTTADLDGDGDLDVLSASFRDDRIAWYENDGAGAFGAQQTITTAANTAFSLTTADLDGDGDLDVLSASFTDDRIAWYENDGTANFSGQQTITTAADAATSVSVADLDGDGDLDVLSASEFDNRIAWYENAPINVNLSVSTNTASEEDTTIITVTATANTAVPSNQTISVAVSGIGITASDFILSDTTITILDGQTTGTVTYTILDDSDIEGDETATITINTPSAGIVLGTTTQNITIADNDDFRVTSIIPIKNALNVSTIADITTTFDENVDPATITATTVSISGRQGLPVSFSVSTASATSAVFNFGRDFFAGEVITATLTPGVLSNTGTGLTPFSAQFTTAVNPLSPGEFPFGQNTITTSANGASSVTTADLDGDGDLDVLSASNIDNRIAWYENDGSGTFGIQQTITTEAGGTFGVSTADLDGDGDLDVLSASQSDNRIAWYENDGAGAFGTQQTITTQAQGAQSVTTADLDGDGDMDVLSASNADNRIAWYENDGSGTFGTQQTITTEAQGARSLTTADLDGDGDLDVLSASFADNRIAWYENDGTGAFGVQQTITVAADGASSVTTADLDGDGDLDVLSASQNDDRITWYENDGTGVFGIQQTITTTADGAINVTTADLDGDGDLDVLSASFADNRIAWYKNDGLGTFGAQQTITTAAQVVFSITTADLDSDGDLDVLSASIIDNRVAWYENGLDIVDNDDFIVASTTPIKNALNVNTSADITISFSDNVDPTTVTATTVRISGSKGVPLSFPTPMISGSSVVFDPSRDFFPGEIITTTLTSEVMSSTGTDLIPFTSQFTTAVNPFSPGEFPFGQNTITTGAGGARSLTTSDLDGDGDLDVLSASQNDNRIAWYENDGTGAFGIQQTITTEAVGAIDVTTADLDGDGHLDVLSASRLDDRIAWYKNDGTGNFGTQQTITTEANGATSVTAADLDGDGDMDVLSSSESSSRIFWYENNGLGTFGTPQTITIFASGGESVTTGDLDGDGDLDVLSASKFNNRIAWYENDGTGNFGAQQTITSQAQNARSVAAADLDGDGDLDVLSASIVDNRIAWYENDGAGAFGNQQTITTAANGAISVTTADLDGDGDLDVLSASLIDDRIAWYENDGTGAFGVQQTITTAADGATSVSVADLNGDGDLDVLSASQFDNRIAWYENTPLCPTTTTYTTAGGWDNGDPTTTTRAIIAENYNTATVGLGDITACELIITTEATLTISDGNTVSVENDITINGTLDVANTGSVVQVQEDAVTINNGSIAVAKTTPTLDDRNFVAMSSPVTAEARDRVYGNSRAVFSLIPSNFVPFVIDFMVFPEFEFAENFLDDNNDYLVPVTGSTETPAAGIGQLIFPQPEPNVGDGAYTLTYTQNPSNPGTLNSGTISVPINYNGPATTNNYNLLGNPYASAIDVTAFINANDAVNEVYYWDHITNPTSALPGFGTSNFSMNDISIRNAMMGIAAVNGGTAPGQFMASGQGFGIKADQAEMMSGTPVVFTNSIRVIGNNDGFRNSETPTGIDKLWLNLTTTAFEEAIAQTGIGFTPNATPSIDKGYDSPRVGTFLSLFTTVDSGELLGIQSREAFDADIEIALGFSTSIEETTQYTISIGEFEGIAIENASVFIIDHLLNTIVDLKEQSYTFTAQKGLHTDRFTIVFQEREALSVDGERFRESEINLYPNPSQGQVTLAYTGPSTLEKAVITDMNGKVVRHIDLSNFHQSQTMDLGALPRGMYFMQITSQNNTITKKLMIR